MKHLAAVNKYFWKYKWRLLLGIIFIVCSNYFRILAPQLTGYVVNAVEYELLISKPSTKQPSSEKLEKQQQGSSHQYYNILVNKIIQKLESTENKSFGKKIFFCGLILLLSALAGGFFMFLMRQTIIVMSRLIEYDQKNDVYTHYQQLDMGFYKRNSTGDLMNRITEDVSRVRMYTGPALMYFINLAATIGFSVFFMWNENKMLTLYVLAPLPLLAITIYFVNTVINKRSERIQSLLSDLTTTSQEAYSGIRVIKSYVQEKSIFNFFNQNSEAYKQSAVSLAKMEAIYFPSMSLIIGLSTLLTIMIGGMYAIQQQGNVSTGTIASFVMYINMLTFPVSAIGWTASMIQRAAASQKRVNEFLNTRPSIQSPENAITVSLSGDITFEKVDFVYPDTGIKALNQFNLHIKKGAKIALIGKTGAGKTTLVQLLLRMYDVNAGSIYIDEHPIKNIHLENLRTQISYVPQDVFLFSDTVANNIRFSNAGATMESVINAAKLACVDKEIQQLPLQYETLIGERGVTLSGGQKQRISIARAILKNPEIVLFDDCLSAVDAKTEKEIITNLQHFLEHKTTIVITHRIFSLFHFDKIVVIEDGHIIEEGTHQQLVQKDGYYATLYRKQQVEMIDDNQPFL